MGKEAPTPTVPAEEMQAIRTELRELRLLTEGLRRCCGPDRVRRAIEDYRWDHEPSFYRSIPRSAPRDKIERHLIDPMTGISTLIDLTFVTRQEIAGIDGVGPTTMAQVDAAMVEHGLSYAEYGAAA